MAQKKPFKVKGQRLVSPKGRALWCRVDEADYQFNDKGTYSTDLVCDPNDKATQAYIKKLEDLRDQAFDEAKNGDGDLKIAPAKLKKLVKADVFKEQFDQDGNETGDIIFKYKLNNVDDRDKGNDTVAVIDANKVKIAHDDLPKVGNDSVIRCKAYVNPYYMPSTNTIGVSMIWEVMQLIELEEFSGGDTDGFDDEDGYSTNGDDSASGFDDDDSDDDQGDDDGDY